MASLYKLTCSCGKSYPVEPTWAGRSIPCDCGQTVTVPSMLKVKRLPLWDENASAPSDPLSPQASPLATPSPSDGTALPAERPTTESKATSPSPSGKIEGNRGEITKEDAKSDRTSPQTVGESVNPPPKETSQKTTAGDLSTPRFSGKKKGILIFGILATLFFGYLTLKTVSTHPRPIDVLTIQRFYLMDNKVIQRDSNPIEPSDLKFFLFDDNTIASDWSIDHLKAFYAYEYFDYLKNGPDLSANFYDKFESLIIKRRLFLSFYGLLFLLSVITCFIPFFMSKQTKVVGVMRGSEWKS